MVAQSTSASAWGKKDSKVNLPDGTVVSLSSQNKMLNFIDVCFILFVNKFQSVVF